MHRAAVEDVQPLVVREIDTWSALCDHFQLPSKKRIMLKRDYLRQGKSLYKEPPRCSAQPYRFLSLCRVYEGENFPSCAFRHCHYASAVIHVYPPMSPQVILTRGMSAGREIPTCWVDYSLGCQKGIEPPALQRATCSDAEIKHQSWDASSDWTRFENSDMPREILASVVLSDTGDREGRKTLQFKPRKYRQRESRGPFMSLIWIT